MRPWTSEQTARRAVVMIGLIGLLTTGIGVESCALSAGDEKYATFGAAYAAISSMLLVQAAGLAAYLRLRGRRGVRVIRLCCAASVAVAAAAGFLSRDVLGGLMWAAALATVATAFFVYSLAVRRVERGDDSPLMPGAERLANTTWKEMVVIFLVCAVLGLLFYAVFGRIPGFHGMRHDEWEPMEAPAPLDGNSMRDFINSDWDEEHGF